ncbi:MAG: universal stress protein [Scytonema sp. PMC 1069.18]|nr:universal stress protein [Scytonema sp. PMC 1069.18]MEC4886105.1 universal stress protein [Scytonema sp. PMC 1070.18]
MSFKKILVAVDSSEQALVVFEQAVELAKKEPASLMVFHGVDLGAKLNYPSEIKMKTQQGEELLETYKAKAQGLDIEAEFSCRVGQPGEAICNLARSWGADLIVLGRRGFRGITEVLLGSVSSYVVRNAPCSVLVLQGECFQGQREENG